MTKTFNPDFKLPNTNKDPISLEFMEHSWRDVSRVCSHFNSDYNGDRNLKWLEENHPLNLHGFKNTTEEIIVKSYVYELFRSIFQRAVFGHSYDYLVRSLYVINETTTFHITPLKIMELMKDTFPDFYSEIKDSEGVMNWLEMEEIPPSYKIKEVPGMEKFQKLVNKLPSMEQMFNNEFDEDKLDKHLRKLNKLVNVKTGWIFEPKELNRYSKKDRDSLQINKFKAIEAYMLATLNNTSLREVDFIIELVSETLALGIDTNGIIEKVNELNPSLYNTVMAPMLTGKHLTNDVQAGSISCVGSSHEIHPYSTNYGSISINNVTGKLNYDNGITPDSLSYIKKTFGNEFYYECREDTSKDYTTGGGIQYTLTSKNAPDNWGTKEDKENRQSLLDTLVDSSQPVNKDSYDITDNDISEWLSKRFNYINTIKIGIDDVVVNKIKQSLENDSAIFEELLSNNSTWNINMTPDNFEFKSNPVIYDKDNCNIYITNLNLLKDLVLKDLLRKEFEPKVKDLHLTSDGWKRIMNKLLGLNK